MSEDFSKVLHQQGAAIMRIEEHIQGFKKTQDQQTDILVEMARAQERHESLSEKLDDTRHELHGLHEKVDDQFLSVFKQMQVYPSPKLSKSQVSMIIGAIAGCFTFLYQIIDKLLCKVLS